MHILLKKSWTERGLPDQLELRATGTVLSSSWRIPVVSRWTNCPAPPATLRLAMRAGSEYNQPERAGASGSEREREDSNVLELTFCLRVGKSSIVNELHKVLALRRGLFASGKFDQYKRDIPYATLAEAFQNVVRQLLSKSEAELNNWREAFQEALGPNGQLMVDLVPELKLIIGEQPRLPDLSPQDAQGRFQRVFQRFIGVFARPEHPVVLFLDDLQWLDAATLDLLEDLLTRSDVRHLVLIGAYRDNEVSSAHPLMRKLEAIRNSGAVVREIILAPLTEGDLRKLISDSLRCEAEVAGSLAQLVHEKTAGNPFFAIQFISVLAEEGLLTFDHRAMQWSWDLDRIYAKGYTDNVVDLLVEKLNRLPVKTQKALQLFACIGNSAEDVLLETAYGDWGRTCTTIFGKRSKPDSSSGRRAPIGSSTIASTRQHIRRYPKSRVIAPTCKSAAYSRRGLNPRRLKVGSLRS
jgi:AAA ATPase domain